MGAQKGKKSARAVPEASETGPASGEPALDRAVQERIGSHLRQMYSDLMQQPVPDRFAELLGRLEQRREDQAR